MKKIGSVLLNKYLLAICFFVVWMLFIDQRDVFYVHEQQKKLKVLEDKKQYYQSEIDKAKQELSDLQNNPVTLEKFAREHYRMKKDGEDLFIIDTTTGDIKN
jgi:cell division protein FtsB